MVDVSVAIKWFLADPGEREALPLLDGGHPLIAAELVVAEVVNAVCKRLISGGMDRAQAAAVPLAVGKLFAELRTLVPLAARALDIARELRHPAYGFLLPCARGGAPREAGDAGRPLLSRLAGTRWQEDAISVWS